MSCDSLTSSPRQQVQVDVSSSCLEHLVCDECWNVHLRGREESGGDGGKGGIEGRRRWRDRGEEEMEGRR